MNEHWNRCDMCGKFIALDDFDHGAVRKFLTPDSDRSSEEYKTLCIVCALRAQVESLTAEVERLRGALEIEGDNTQSWKNLFRQKDKAWQEEHTERIRLEERLKHVEGVLERLREMDNDALQGGEG